MELSNGQKWRRHQDQLQKRVVGEPDGGSSDNIMDTVLGGHWFSVVLVEFSFLCVNRHCRSYNTLVYAIPEILLF